MDSDHMLLILVLTVCVWISVCSGENGEDQHVGPAIAAIMKLSYDEEYRAAICTLGKCRY